MALRDFFLVLFPILLALGSMSYAWEPGKNEKSGSEKPTEVKTHTMDDYYILADRAFKERKCLVVLVGMSPGELEKSLPGSVAVFLDQLEQALPGCLHCWLDRFPGAARIAIVFGVPDAKWLTRHDLPEDANVGQILKVLPREYPKKTSGK